MRLVWAKINGVMTLARVRLQNTETVRESLSRCRLLHGKFKGGYSPIRDHGVIVMRRFGPEFDGNDYYPPGMDIQQKAMAHGRGIVHGTFHRTVCAAHSQEIQTHPQA